MSRSGGQVAAASSSSRSASTAAWSAPAPGSRLEKIRMPCASPARSPARSSRAVSSGRVNRRATDGAWPAPEETVLDDVGPGSSASASAYFPASARCSTAATVLAASTLTVPPGRSTRATAASAASGESTYSSTLWQITRSAPVRSALAPAVPGSPTSAGRSTASPWTSVSVTPLSAARQPAAARASGLGSTTVTRWPRLAMLTANPPVPAPTSTMSRAARPDCATRAAMTSARTSQTSDDRDPSRLRPVPVCSASVCSVSGPRMPGTALAGTSAVTLNHSLVNLAIFRRCRPGATLEAKKSKVQARWRSFTVVVAAGPCAARQGASPGYLTHLLHYQLSIKQVNQGHPGPVLMTVQTSSGSFAKRTKATRRGERMTPREASGPRMLNRMPAATEHLELPHPRRLLCTSAWSMAESVGLPFGTYVVITVLVSPDAGLLAGTAVVWLLIALRKILTGSVTSLLTISALVLTVQTAVAVSTGFLWMFQLS